MPVQTALRVSMDAIRAANDRINGLDHEAILHALLPYKYVDHTHADALLAMIRDMTDAELHGVSEVVRQVQIERAIGTGDEDAIIASAFETAFGRDGLPVLPWVEGMLTEGEKYYAIHRISSYRFFYIHTYQITVKHSGRFH